MPAITFNVPEPLAAQIAAIPETERDAWVTEVLQDALDDELPAPPLTEAELKDMAGAFADMDAGRVISGETFFATLRSEIGLPPRPWKHTGSDK